MKKILLFMFLFVSIVYGYDDSFWVNYLNDNRYLLQDSCEDKPVQVVQVIHLGVLPCNFKDSQTQRWVQGKDVKHLLVLYNCPPSINDKIGLHLYYYEEGQIETSKDAIKCLPRF